MANKMHCADYKVVAGRHGRNFKPRKPFTACNSMYFTHILHTVYIGFAAWLLNRKGPTLGARGVAGRVVRIHH